MTRQTPIPIITEPKEMVQALNFGKYKVLKFDITGKEKTYVGCVKETRNKGAVKSVGVLRSGFNTKDDEELYVMNAGTMLAPCTSASDWVKLANEAQAPTLVVGETVAVLYHLEDADVAFVRLVEVSKINHGCSDMIRFVDSTK